MKGTQCTACQCTLTQDDYFCPECGAAIPGTIPDFVIEPMYLKVKLEQEAASIASQKEALAWIIKGIQSEINSLDCDDETRRTLTARLNVSRSLLQ